MSELRVRPEPDEEFVTAFPPSQTTHDDWIVTVTDELWDELVTSHVRVTGECVTESTVDVAAFAEGEMRLSEAP